MPNSSTGNLKFCTEMNGLTRLIQQPTRVTDRSKTTVDLIFVNNQSVHNDSGVFYMGTSDHFLMYTIRTTKHGPTSDPLIDLYIQKWTCGLLTTNSFLWF